MEQGLVEQVAKDPVILGLASILPPCFKFKEGEEDYAMNLANWYVEECYMTGREPLTSNPSVVRWAIEEILVRWGRILGRSAELEN